MVRITSRASTDPQKDAEVEMPGGSGEVASRFRDARQPRWVEQGVQRQATTPHSRMLS